MTETNASRLLDEFQQWLVFEVRESAKYDPLRYREDMYIYDKLIKFREKYEVPYGLDEGLHQS